MKWDGVAWFPLGSGIEGQLSEVRALTVFDDGSGAALYAGGTFSLAGGLPAENVAKWDGKHWSAVGEGIGGQIKDVNALAVFDNGSGSRLFLGGRDASFGSGESYNLASWNGLAWMAHRYSDPTVSSSAEVTSLVVLRTESGDSLYAGGYFYSYGNPPESGLAKLDGESLAIVPNAPVALAALAEFDDGAGNALYAGGDFRFADGILSAFLARWRCPCPHCDANADDAIDLPDYLAFWHCLDGPAVPAVSECLNVRLDAGAYVDLRDYATFQNNFTGP